MEPTKQGVPDDPSSSQQQPQPHPYAPQSMLPAHRRAVQRPQPQQQNPPPQQQNPPPFAPQHAVQRSQPQQQYPAPFAQQHAVQRPQLPNLQRPWEPYLSTPQAHRWGYTPHGGAATPSGINASHYGADTPHFNGSIFFANHGHTSAGGPQAGATDPFSARNDDASLDPYIFALLGPDQVHVALACTRGAVPLLDVANGVTYLQNLLESVNPYPQLRWQLIYRLMCEGLFHHRTGPDLLRSFFTTSAFPHQDSAIVIQHALDNFFDVLTSPFGPNSMVECFMAARNLNLQADLLQHFEKIISRHMVRIARGQFSNYFLQDVLKHGCEGLRAKITGLVVKNLVILSLDRYGTHVAQACFPGVAAGGLPLLVQLRLPCALKEFLFLSEARLEQLVEDKYASYVVRKLLVSGKNCKAPDSLSLTEALARKIKELPVMRRELVNPHVRQVMLAVRMVLPMRQGR